MRPSGWVGRLALALLGTLVGLAVFECGLRAWVASRPALERLFRDWDPVVDSVELLGERSYRPRPGSTFHYANGSAAHENSQGFRGPEVRAPKPAGTFRIVLLGGSTSHGFGVDDDATIDAHLRRRLAERHPGRVFEVVNLGFDGYDSECDYDRLKADGLALEPDVVILHSGINDVLPSRFGPAEGVSPHAFEWALGRLREQRRRGGLDFWEGVKHRFYAARLPGILRHLSRPESSFQPQAGPPVPPPGGTDRFAGSLRRAGELVPATSVLLFSTPPSALRFDARVPPAARAFFVVDAPTTQRYRDALDARMRATAAAFAAEGRQAVYVPHAVPVELFTDDCHLTSAGNRQVATDFAEALEPFLAER